LDIAIYIDIAGEVKQSLRTGHKLEPKIIYHEDTQTATTSQVKARQLMLLTTAASKTVQ